MTYPDLLSVHQVAEMLGITPHRTRALIRSGRLAAVKMGRDWFVQPAAVEMARERKPGRPKKAKGQYPRHGFKLPSGSGPPGKEVPAPMLQPSGRAGHRSC